MNVSFSIFNCITKLKPTLIGILGSRRCNDRKFFLKKNHIFIQLIDTCCILHLPVIKCFLVLTQFKSKQPGMESSPEIQPIVVLRVFKFVLGLVSPLVWMSSSHISHELPSEVMALCVCFAFEAGVVNYRLNKAH